MFVGRLSENEKVAFAVLLEKMIHSDEVLSLEEETIRLHLYKEMNLELQPDLDAFTIESACQTFRDREAKVIALIELIGVGMVDADYSDSESEMIKKIGRLFGFSENQVAECEATVTGLVNAYDAAESLIEGV